MKRIALGICLLASACSARQSSVDPQSVTLTPLETNTPASLRGLSVVSERVVWASGASGTVLRTTDGGSTWQVLRVPGADSLDFRDIEAFDSLAAFVLSAGEDGRIYKTVDGGRSWTLQFRNRVKNAFYDCFDFHDRRTGIAMSDPVAGRYLLMTTVDGETWQEVPAADRPSALTGEAAFAASGTCVTIAGGRTFIASGGGAAARVFYRDGNSGPFSAVTTPVPAGAPSAGIFALAFRNANDGIAIGGDYQQPAKEATVAVTRDGGRSWQSAGSTSYSSGAAWSGDLMIAVGTPGTRISADGARTWMTIDRVEYNAVQFANDQVAFAVGPRGRIARLNWAMF